MLQESKQGCHVKNPAAFLNYMKRGIVDVYVSVTDGVTIKAGPK